MRYAVYILLCLLLAALCAFVWRRVAQIPAVRDHIDMLYARAVKQVTSAASAGNARRDYLLLVWTLPSALCTVVLLLGSRLLERLFLGRAEKLPPGKKPYSRAASALAPIALYLSAAVSRGKIVSGMTDARVIARLGLAEPHRYVETILTDGSAARVPAYLAHPDYEALYRAEYPIAQLAHNAWAWAAGAALVVLVDFICRLYRRVRAERRAQVPQEE